MFALVDCNNFYVSCERLFRPDLEEKPVIVLSNNDGCIVARSQEAKSLGVPMAEAIFDFMPLLKKHRVTLFSSNYTLYADISGRVMDVLSRFTPNLEVYSIDEAFLDLTDTPTSQVRQHCRELQATVKQWTGIPVSIGVARTKTLAKLANYHAKHTPSTIGIYHLHSAAMEASLLATSGIGNVWGIGPRFTRKLEQFGVTTAWQYSRAPDDWIRRNFTVTGLRIAYELRGITCLALECLRPDKREICSSRSFGKPVTSQSDLEEAIVCYTSRAAKKLRDQCSCAGLVTVLVATSLFADEPYYSNSATVRLPVASDHTGELIGYAVAGLGRIFRPGCAYKKAGVILANLVPADRRQPDFFDRYDRDRCARLMRACDSIKAKMGSANIEYLGAGLNPDWAMRRARLSPRYTTSWDDLLVVTAG